PLRLFSPLPSENKHVPPPAHTGFTTPKSPQIMFSCVFPSPCSRFLRTKTPPSDPRRPSAPAGTFFPPRSLGKSEGERQKYAVETALLRFSSGLEVRELAESGSNGFRQRGLERLGRKMGRVF